MGLTNMMAYNKYKPGDTVFLNGNRLTIKSSDPKVYGSHHNYYIYADTEEKGVVAIPIW
jgi:hypothetical protein